MQQQNPLGYQSIPSLLKSFAIPSIIAMLVGSLYNIVDQVFIGQGVGYLGNAATNVSYPLTTICLAISLLIGIGSASRFSLYLGSGRQENAAKVAGNGICMMVVFGVIYAVLVELFLTPLLTAFGATAAVMPYAATYSRIIALGMPFQIITTGMSKLILADGSPKYSMTCTLIGAVINTILDPLFIFTFDMGVAGAAWATIIGQVFLLPGGHRLCPPVQEHPAAACLPAPESPGMRADCQPWHEQQSQPGGHHAGTDRHEQLLTLLRRPVRLRHRHSPGRLRYRHENQRDPAVYHHRNFPGIQPIIGFNYGAGQYDRVKKTYKLAILYNFIVSGIGFILFQGFPRQIISLFGNRRCGLLYLCHPLYADLPVQGSSSTAYSCCPPTFSRPSANPSRACSCP